MNSTKEELVSKTREKIESLQERAADPLIKHLLKIIAMQNNAIDAFYEYVYKVDPHLAEEAIGKAAEHLYDVEK